MLVIVMIVSVFMIMVVIVVMTFMAMFVVSLVACPWSLFLGRRVLLVFEGVCGGQLLCLPGAKRRKRTAAE